VGLDLPGRLRAAAPGCRFVAMGGATEAGIWSNWIEVREVPDAWRSIPYGLPLPNQAFRVVDARGRDCPDWVPGELWIGGGSVALGYRGDPERSARQFVEREGTRWYRTGDLGRYWPDGTLEFLGRADHQVKIRGHRIELGEIEANLEAHPDVVRAVVVVVAGEGARRLVGFVVAGAAAPAAASLRDFLSERLPAYMVPEEIAVLDALPLTANGKVDRRAIELLASGIQVAPGDPPSGPVETEIAALLGGLLGREAISRQDNFFGLGGDSLLAARAVEALGRRFGIEMSLRRMFGAPTVRELAQVIGEQLAAGHPVEEGVV
jgi:acyl-coenzyme A synthetase/AMP-(fatty) acid ligase/acyl carrier protein